jgi:glutathione synthase/RimK-type ligase-like ATP-grasp enzyme
MGSRSPARVLVVGPEHDAHIGAVLDLCRQSGAECLSLSKDSLLSFEFQSSTNARQPARKLRSSYPEPSAIWWRLKRGFFQLREADATNQFIRREWSHVLESLETIFGSAKWINPRAADKFIGHKPQQLWLAKKCGLKVPATLITNDPQRAAEFIECQPNKRAIFKIFSWMAEPTDHVIFANIVDRDAVRANADNVRRAPGIFQEVVPKAYELRITVVERNIFAVHIDSQARSDTEIDWRRNQDDVPYSIETKLPNRFVDRLLDFHSEAGLVYGAYDFVVTPQDEWVFLEVNPTGQWLWLEQLTGIPITAAVASALTSR